MLVRAFTNDGPIGGRLRELTVQVVAINPGSRPTDVDALKRHGVAAVVMPDVGHFPMLEAPDRFDRTLAQVVETLDRG